MELIKGLTSTSTLKKEALIILDAINEHLSSDKTFLDIGSGDGSFLNIVKEHTDIENLIGVEIQKSLHEKASVDHSYLELHNDNIVNKLDIVERADVIFINNSGMPNYTFWEIWDSIKPGAVVVYNNISLSIKLKGSLGHSISDIRLNHALPFRSYHYIVKKS